MAHDIFISHSSTNKAAADAVCHALESNGIRCWIAPRDVPPGSKFGAEITKGIRDCKVFLLVFSDEVNNSEAVQKEIERATLGFKKPILPFYIENAPVNDNIQFFISDTHRIDAYKEKHWIDAYPDSKVFDDLIGSVKNMLNISTESSVPATERPPGPSKNSGRFVKFVVPAIAVVIAVICLALLLKKPAAPDAAAQTSGGNAQTTQNTLSSGYVEINGERIEISSNKADLSDKGITEINSLQAPATVTFLDLYNNKIEDITALQLLPGLTHINAYNNKIEDVGPLQALVGLEWLILADNNISDISPLRSLVELDYLKLDDNQISDISALQGLTKLTFLSLNNNGLSDVAPLKLLTKLKELHITGNNFTEDQIKELKSALPECQIFS